MPSIVCLAFTPCKWFFKSVILIIHLLPLMLAFFIYHNASEVIPEILIAQQYSFV